MKQDSPLPNKSINDIPFGVYTTPYYWELCKNNKKLLKTILPLPEKYNKKKKLDSLNEDSYRVSKCLIKKYPRKALFLTTSVCKSHCSYCTRQRLVFNEEYTFLDIDEAINNIKKDVSIKDVILSGGDPLTLTNTKLFYIIDELYKIDHVKIVRIGTKMLAVYPDRFNEEFIERMKFYSKTKPIYFSFHFTHKDELTDKVKEVASKLRSAGCVLGSQTVLMKDVNDTEKDLKNLFMELFYIGIKPYYIYEMDKISCHKYFAVPTRKGKKLMKSLYNNISGYAIPLYIKDTKKGKIPVIPKL